MLGPRRTVRRAFAALVAAATVAAGLAVPAPTAEAAPPGDDAVVAFLVKGYGFGHGRGMSQWGMLGRALAGQSWPEILAAYYQGTVPGNRTGDIRVRLMDWNDEDTVAVISRGGQAAWTAPSRSVSPARYTSLYATFDGSTDTFSVYGTTSGFGCADELPVPRVDLQRGSSDTGAVRQLQALLNDLGHDAGAVDGDFGPKTEAAVIRFQQAEGLTADGLWRSQEWDAAQTRLDSRSGPDWQLLASGVSGPITFSTSVSESAAGPGDVLGACEPGGGVTHYRGTLELHSTPWGNRLVNETDIEQYLRGVVPMEFWHGWGDSGGGKGMHALRSQAVASRSYALSQNRYNDATYPYADTCDTTSCQLYAGAATRPSGSSSTLKTVERTNTDNAIDDTASVVRVWPSSGAVAATEFSASNGPRTAGGAFPSIDDPFDDIEQNDKHTWTRIIDADTVARTYGLGSADAVRTVVDPGLVADGYEWVWSNEVSLGDTTVSNWSFRGTFGLPSPGFELIPLRRTMSSAASFAFIGDSVGTGIVGSSSKPFEVVTEGVFSTARFDAVSSRRTQGGTVQPDGVAVARTVPVGTELVVVELGYNDSPSAMPGQIDALMAALRDQGVGRVAWVGLSERSTRTDFAVANAALRDARGRWPELVVLDWHGASDHAAADRWFDDDGIHLTWETGNAEFADWLRHEVLGLLDDDYVPPPVVVRYPIVGARASVCVTVPIGSPGDVAVVNITNTNAASNGWGALRASNATPLYDRPEVDRYSSVNFSNQTPPNPNLAFTKIGPDGRICYDSGNTTSNVILDLAATIPAANVNAIDSDRILDTRNTTGIVGAKASVCVTVPIGSPGDVAVVNITNTNAASNGWGALRASNATPLYDRPEVDRYSSVNFSNQTPPNPNLAFTKIGPDGRICYDSGNTTSNVILDLAATIPAANVNAIDSDRILDTRNTTGIVGARASVCVTVPIGSPGDVAVVNITNTNAASNGWGALRASNATPLYDRPEVDRYSSVNFSNQTPPNPNLAFTKIGPDGRICYDSGNTTSNVILDLAATIPAANVNAIDSDRILDTRNPTSPPESR